MPNRLARVINTKSTIDSLWDVADLLRTEFGNDSFAVETVLTAILQILEDHRSLEAMRVKVGQLRAELDYIITGERSA
jgi:hypothetical protein